MITVTQFVHSCFNDLISYSRDLGLLGSKGFPFVCTVRKQTQGLVNPECLKLSLQIKGPIRKSSMKLWKEHLRKILGSDELGFNWEFYEFLRRI